MENTKTRMSPTGMISRSAGPKTQSILVQLRAYQIPLDGVFAQRAQGL